MTSSEHRSRGRTRIAALTGSVKRLLRDLDSSHHGGILQSQDNVVSFEEEENCTVGTQCSDVFAGSLKSVRFGTLEIHRHAIILGYNPGGTLGGPPLDIDWLALDTEIHALEDFETTRGPRRDACALKRTKEDRRQVLQSQGYTQEVIQIAEELAEAIRLQRQISALDFQLVESEQSTIDSKTAPCIKKDVSTVKSESTRSTNSTMTRQKKIGGLRGVFRLKLRTKKALTSKGIHEQ